MQQQVDDAFKKDKKQEFEIYCDLAQTYRYKSELSAQLAFMASMFEPLDDVTPLPCVLDFFGSSALFEWPIGLLNRAMFFDDTNPENSALAIEYYKKAASAKPFEGDKDNPQHKRVRYIDNYAVTNALFTLGIIYASGSLTPPNPAQAIDYMQKAIARGEDSPDAFAYLGKSFAAEGRWQEAINALVKAAKKGHAVAHDDLATIFAEGNETVQKNPKRVFCYLKAVNDIEPSISRLRALTRFLWDNPGFDALPPLFVHEHLRALDLQDKEERRDRFLCLAMLETFSLNGGPCNTEKEMKWLQKAYNIDPAYTACALARAFEVQGDEQKALQY